MIQNNTETFSSYSNDNSGIKTLTTFDYANSDIIADKVDEIFYLRENESNLVQTVSQTCSKTGETNLVSSIAQNSGNFIPNWVTYNPAAMQLQISTPSETMDTTYSFKILTKYEEYYSDSKTIFLKVLNWQVLNWAVCQVDPTLCQSWVGGYTLSSDSKSWNVAQQQTTAVISPTVKSTQAAAQAAVGAGVAVGSTTSILSATSTQGVWASINQFQLYLLIPMLGIYIHSDVLDFLKGFSFVFFSLPQLRIEELEFVKYFLYLFSDQQNNDYLSSIGLPYVSTFRNLSRFFLIILIILSIHALILVPLYYCSRKFTENSKFRRIINYILAVFAWSIYLRLMLESYLVGFLSCINELWIAGPTSSIVLLFIFISFLVLFFVIWIKSWSELYDTETSYFREFFSGIKQTKTSRIYFSTFLLRRVVWIMTAVALNNSSVYLQTGLFAAANILCLMFTVFIRPFVSIKDNIIETINDFSFGLFCIMLLYFNQKNTWTDAIANVVIYFLLTWSMLSTLINSGFMIYEITKWAINRWSKNSIAKIHATQDHNIIVIRNPFIASNINNATTLSNTKISAISG